MKKNIAEIYDFMQQIRPNLLGTRHREDPPTNVDPKRSDAGPDAPAMQRDPREDPQPPHAASSVGSPPARDTRCGPAVGLGRTRVGASSSSS